MFLVRLDAKHVQLLMSALSALTHLSSKEMFVKLNAIMDSLLLDQSVEDALKDVFNVLKTLSAITALMVSICTMELAIRFALLELSETALQQTGFVILAIHLARLASIILLIVPAARTERDIFKLQPLSNHASKPVMMVPTPTMEFVRSAISSVLPALEAPATVSHALKVSFFIREDAGQLALEFFFPTPELKPHALTHALMDFTSTQPLPVLLAQFNVPLVMEDPITVLHAFKDQLLLMELVLPSVVRMSSVSLEFVLLVMNHAMDAQLHQLTVNHALLDMLDLDQSAKKDVFQDNSSMLEDKPVLTAPEIALAVHLPTTAQSAQALTSVPEVEFARAAHTPATPVTDPTPVLVV